MQSWAPADQRLSASDAAYSFARTRAAAASLKQEVALSRCFNTSSPAHAVRAAHSDDPRLVAGELGALSTPSHRWSGGGTITLRRPRGRRNA